MMRKNGSACAVASAFALATAANNAHASAFALYEQGISGLGTSYAGAAAVAEDATTAWWNPAGMSWLPSGKHVAASLAYIDPSTKFSDRGSVAARIPPAPPRPLGDTGGDAGQSAWLPSLFFAMDIAPRLNFGFVVNAPFGLKTEYDQTWLGRFQGISSRVKTLNFNPSLSVLLTDNLSCAFGVSYLRGECD